MSLSHFHLSHFQYSHPYYVGVWEWWESHGTTWESHGRIR